MATDATPSKPIQRFLKREMTEFLTEPVRDGIENLKMILIVPPRERTESQIQTLVSYTKHIKFFSELSEKEGAAAHQQCVQNMFYQSIKSGQFLFHAGDEGSRFYIILSGSVAVLAPNQRRDGKCDFALLTMLRGGESFGELALISNKPRAASILTREPTALAVLERNDYLRLLSRIQDARLSQRVELLQRHPAFASWSKNSLQKLSYFFKQHTYKRKQVLFHAGQSATEVFVVQSGDFQLTKTILVDLKRRGQLLKELEPTQHSAEVTLISTGEMIGDQECIAGGLYEYTCMCYSAQGEALQISRDDFLKRVVSEDSVGCLQGLNRLKATYRSGRIELISKMETQKWATQVNANLLKDLPIALDSHFNTGSIELARSSLKAEVRKRWHLPPSHIRSLALDKAMCQQWLRSPMTSPPSSPSPDLRSELSASPTSLSQKQRQRSWLELVERKYFHKRAASGALIGMKREGESPVFSEASKGRRASGSSTMSTWVRGYV